MAIKNIPIGQVLKEAGYVTEEQIQQALAYQKEHKGKPLGMILTQLGFVTEYQALQALSQRLELKLLDLSEIRAELEAVEMIPLQLAEKYNMLAIAVTDSVLTVVTSDPMNLYAQEDIRQLTGKILEVCLAEKAR